MEWQDKTVWITGASSGIGKELALRLSALGAKLLLSSRRLEALETVRQQCQNPERHTSIPLDLAASAQFPEQVTQVIAQQGPIDVLINNGGISQRSQAIDTSMDVYRQIMEVDYFGSVALTQALLPHLLERKQGHIISISSIAGKMGVPLRTAYCSAKHALIGYMDALRAETSSQGIRVSVVCPGFVQTDVSVNALSGDGSAHGQMDNDIANGMPVDACVLHMLSAIAGGQDEIIIAEGIPKFAQRLRQLAPNLSHKVTSRAARRFMDTKQ